MENTWSDKLNALVRRVGGFSKANAPVAKAFHELETAARHSGVLDAKTHELISLAVAVTTRCDGCIVSHAAAAKKAGATKDEIAAALGTAIALNAGAAFVYSSRALEAFEELCPPPGATPSRVQPLSAAPGDTPDQTRAASQRSVGRAQLTTNSLGRRSTRFPALVSQRLFLGREHSSLALRNAGMEETRLEAHRRMRDPEMPKRFRHLLGRRRHFPVKQAGKVPTVLARHVDGCGLHADPMRHLRDIRPVGHVQFHDPQFEPPDPMVEVDDLDRGSSSEQADPARIVRVDGQVLTP